MCPVFHNEVIKIGKIFFSIEMLEKLVHPKINLSRRTGGLPKPVILVPWITDPILYTELKCKLVGRQSITSHFQVYSCPGKVLGTFSKDITLACPLRSVLPMSEPSLNGYTPGVLRHTWHLKMLSGVTGPQSHCQEPLKSGKNHISPKYFFSVLNPLDLWQNTAGRVKRKKKNQTPSPPQNHTAVDLVQISDYLSRVWCNLYCGC